MEEMKKTGFGQSLTLCLVTWKENVVKEKGQHVFSYFTTRKLCFFFVAEIQSEAQWGWAFCFGNGYIFFKLSLYYIFLCFIPKHEKDMFFFFFLFHLLNNWGKRKKTQNLIEIWFSCAIYNQLWVEDFMND